MTIINGFFSSCLYVFRSCSCMIYHVFFSFLFFCVCFVVLDDSFFGYTCEKKRGRLKIDRQKEKKK